MKTMAGLILMVLFGGMMILPITSSRVAMTTTTDIGEGMSLDEATAGFGKPPSALATVAKSFQDLAQGFYQHIHMNPELSWQEFNTMAYVQSLLDPLLSVPSPFFRLTAHNSSIPAGGLWYDLDVLALANSSSTRVLFRADMDAIPVQEASGLPWSSQVPGVCHCDGHDIHTATLMAAVISIVRNQTLLGPMLTSHLRFVFQRAEEVTQGLSGGHSLVLNSPVLSSVASCFAIHVAGSAPPSFQTHGGPFTARSDWFNLSFSCNGGHVGSPYLGTNCLRVVAAVQSALFSFPAQFLPPGTAVSLEPSMLSAGTSSNIMPSAASAAWSSRSFLSAPLRDLMWLEIRQVIAAVVQSFNLADTGHHASFSMHTIEGDPPLHNDPAIASALAALLKQNQIRMTPALTNLGGEDFAYYMEKIPGLYSFWGLGGKGYNHSPDFAPDSSNIWHGIHYWLVLATNSISASSSS